MSEITKARVTLVRDLITLLVTDNEAAAAARSEGLQRGPRTNLRALDEALGGHLAPGVHILQAGPGAGKTALALQIAATCGFPALFITAEMPILELFRRLIARSTGTFLGRLKSGELSTREITALAHQMVEKSPWLAIMDATAGYAEPSLICETVTALRERANSASVLVVVDSIQNWARSCGLQQSEYEVISAGIRSLADVAAKLSSPILAISHRNRANQEKGGLHAGKGSGDLEYLAETVLELTREKETRTDITSKVPVGLAIHKNRHGLAGFTLALEFAGRLQLFTEK